MIEYSTASGRPAGRERTCTAFYPYVKRLLDIVLSAFMLVLLSPVMLVLALAIKLSSVKEKVVFSQERVGLHGRLFKIYKFRSMSSKAPANVATNELENAEKYITPIGAFMRKTSLDEILQFFNVLKGDMSIVGPRPLVYTETEIHSLRESSGVYDVRPGITGLAQISGRDNLDVYQKVIYDSAYVKKMSFSFDLLMIVGTVVAVATGAGVVDGKKDAEKNNEDLSPQKLASEKNPRVKKILVGANCEIMVFGLRKELMSELVSRGYDVLTTYTRTEFGNGDDAAKKFGCKYIETKINGHGTNPFQDIALFFSYMKILKSFKPDVVFTYSIKPNIYLGYACRLKKVPYIVNVTGLGLAVEEHGILQHVTMTMYRIAMKKARRVFFQNKENMDFFNKHNVVGKAGMLIPGSGVNLDTYKPLPYPDGDKVHFLFISRVMRNKGIEQLFAAAENVKKRHPEVVFHILGLLAEERYKSQMDELCEKGVIEYHGLCDNVLEFQKISSCTIHPTFYPEGMSNVLLETAACARPAITTDRSGCREIVEDGVNGFICRQRDAVSLEEQIERFLSLSVEQRREMGLRGREKVEKQFDRKIVVGKYIDEVNSVFGIENPCETKGECVYAVTGENIAGYRKS